MKKIIIITCLFANLVNAQIDLNFNQDELPTTWDNQGNFEVLDYAIHPKCESLALTASLFNENQESWIATEAYPYQGGNVVINMTHGIKDLYNSLNVYTHFHKLKLFLYYTEGSSEDWTLYQEFDLAMIEQSTNCMNFSTTINANLLNGFESVKYKFSALTPPTVQTPYLLYWSIDSLSVAEDTSMRRDDFTFQNTTIYPNPVVDFLSFNEDVMPESIVVYNLLGQQIFAKKIESNNKKINVSHLPLGTYVLKLTKEGSTKSFKFIKR